MLRRLVELRPTLRWLPVEVRSMWAGALRRLGLSLSLGQLLGSLSLGRTGLLPSLKHELAPLLLLPWMSREGLLP